MKLVAIFSIRLIIGLIGAQLLPVLLGGLYNIVSELNTFFTMVGLSYILIKVGYEFDIDKNKVRS